VGEGPDDSADDIAELELMNGFGHDAVD